MKNKTLVAIVGPTAIGKTALSIDIAKALNTEIISCDSRQFFSEMKIGTAPPSPEELDMVKHHFIGHLSVNDEYSVGAFEKDTLNLLNKLFKEKDTIVMVGGSGLYADAVIKGLDVFPDIDPKIREQLKTKSIGDLQKLLEEKDPEYYNTVDINNPQRLIRALEIVIGTDKFYSHYRKQNQAERPFNTIVIGLNTEREQLYDRINKRVDLMMEAGLLKEAKQLYPLKHLNALQTVGYRELFEHFDNKISLEKAVEEIKKNTRRFAKRQITWFKRTENIVWFEPLQKQEILNYILNNT